MPTREDVLNSAQVEVLHEGSLLASAEETENTPGQVSRRQADGVEDLVQMIRLFPSEPTGVISKYIHIAKNMAVDNSAPTRGKMLSKLSGLPCHPKKGGSNDHRPASNACLIACNMPMPHIRMNNENVPIPGLSRLAVIGECK